MKSRCRLPDGTSGSRPKSLLLRVHISLSGFQVIHARLSFRVARMFGFADSPFQQK